MWKYNRYLGNGCKFRTGLSYDRIPFWYCRCCCNADRTGNFMYLLFCCPAQDFFFEAEASGFCNKYKSGKKAFKAWDACHVPGCNHQHCRDGASVSHQLKHMDRKHEYQVNFSLAMKICFDFLRGVAPPDIESLISKYILPIRPERNYARQHRVQKPASFSYRFV